MSSERVLPGALTPGDAVLESHHLQLEPLPRLVRAARAFIREHAPPLAPETLDVLLLLTSELVTNAVLHARTPIELGITIADRSLLITVHDEDLARPEQQPYTEREGGWGLGLVRSLADDYALEMHAGAGKTAWFRLSRTTPRTGEPGAAGRPQDELGEERR
jgi:two-component sensor histidine kinase